MGEVESENYQTKPVKWNKVLSRLSKKIFFLLPGGNFFFSLASTETEVLFHLGFWDQVIKSLLN